MARLIVYYSLEGSTAFLSEELKTMLGEGTDILRLIPDKEPPKKGFLKIMVGGFFAISRKHVTLDPILVDLDDYDTIILASPIWAGTYPPAMGEFLRRYQLKNKTLHLILTSGSGDIDKARAGFEEILGEAKITSVLNLPQPLKDTIISREKLAAYAKEI